MIEIDAVCDDCPSSKSHDSDSGLVRLQPTGEINRTIIPRAHKAQTELRISVPNCKQFFLCFHNTDLTRMLSQKPSHKFLNNEFITSHAESGRCSLIGSKPDTTRNLRYMTERIYVPFVRLEVLGETEGVEARICEFGGITEKVFRSWKETVFYFYLSILAEILVQFSRV
jgi:hypothetical protein